MPGFSVPCIGCQLLFYLFTLFYLRATGDMAFYINGINSFSFELFKPSAGLCFSVGRSSSS